MTIPDLANADFWDELCGSALARQLGVTDGSPESLRRFDRAYFELYPYLLRHLRPILERRGRTLEIGLGYGTVSGYLAAAGVDYHGLDIARGPVEMVHGRLIGLQQAEVTKRVVQGSALDIPWPDMHFDAVVSIGCLHHTGSLARSVQEVNRVLVPSGIAMIMVYNRNSLRQLTKLRPRALLKRLRGEGDDPMALLGYDANAAGSPAPFTEFSSVTDVRRLFSQFRDVRVVRENMDPILLLRIPREKLLGWPARLFGLDLYVTAVK